MVILYISSKRKKIYFIFYFSFIYFYYTYILKEIINFKIKREINKLNSFFKLCNDGILINNKKFKKVKYPKISIISTIFNREKFILRHLRSIQNQFFDDIEIIFIDDCSVDNSVKIIEYFQKQDERITLIKQNKNKGTLITRNIGILFSKGKYVIIPDSDDILSQNILIICYKLSINKNLEMIRFNSYKQADKGKLIKIKYKIKKKYLYQPDISTFIFYGLGYLKTNDFAISNKFIKRELFIRTLNYIDKFYLNQYMIVYEDSLINFALHCNAKKLYLLDKIGYYYLNNPKSITKRRVEKNEVLKYIFLYLKFIYENTKNNNYEKAIPFYLINKLTRNFKLIYSIKKNFKFYEKIINKYLNCKFINHYNKIKLLKIINLLKIREKSIK